MDSARLREIQRPIKERYRADPQAAVITLRAQGALGESGVACSVETGRALVEAGLHPATGGDGSMACSGDMLLQALVACAGVTLRSVATNRGIEVTGTVRAEGDLDFRAPSESTARRRSGSAPFAFSSTSSRSRRHRSSTI